MSKETFTSVKDRTESGENLETPSAEDLKAQFDAPAFDGVRPNGEQVTSLSDEADWIEAHTYVEDKYRLTSEDLIEGRMVISPYITGPITRQVQTAVPEPQPAESVKVAPAENQTPGTPTETQEVNSAENEKKIGLFRRMGRGALKAANWLDQKGAGFSVWAINKFGGMSAAERKEYQLSLNEKYASTEGDTRWQKIKNYFGRNKLNIRDRVVPYGTAMALGAMVVDKVFHGAVDISNIQNHEVALAAHTVFTIGGATDVHGDLATAGGETMGLYDNGAKNIKAEYSASIGPFVGPVRMEDSTNEVIPQAFAAYEQANGGPMTMYGFSEGSVAAWKSAEALAASGADVSNIDLVVDGGPLGAMGLGNSKYVGAVNPFLKAAGIDITRDLPNLSGFKSVTVRSYSGDLWGAGGNDSGVAQAAMVAGLNGHQQVDANRSVLIKSEVIDGVRYEEYAYPDGPQHPLGRLLYSQGMQVSPAMDRLLDAMVPVTHLGEDTQYANANKLSDAFGAFLDESISGGTGMNSGQASEIIKKMMAENPQYAGDLQNMLDLMRTADRFAEMANNPASIATELPQAMNEIQDAIGTATKYLDPNSWVGMINNGLKAAGLGDMFQLQQFEQSAAGVQASQSYTPAVKQTLSPEMTQALQGNVQQYVANFQQQMQNWVNNLQQQAHTAANNTQQTAPAWAPPVNSSEASWPTAQPYTAPSEAFVPRASAPAASNPADQAGQTKQAAPMANVDLGEQVRDTVNNLFKPPVTGNQEVPVANDIPTAPIVTEPAAPPRAAADVAGNVGVPLNPLPTPPKVDLPRPEEVLQNAGKQANDFFQNLMGGGHNAAPQAPVTGGVPAPEGMVPVGAPTGPAS